RNRLRQALVIAEVALALVLLTSAGLLIKSFVQLQSVDAGFNPRNVLTMEISLPALTYTDSASQARFYSEAQKRIASISAIINAALAKRYWPNEDPIGKRIDIDASGAKEKWATIIGIVGNVRHRGLDYDPLPEYYMPITQTPNGQAVLVVRSSQEAASLSSAIRTALREIDP